MNESLMMEERDVNSNLKLQLSRVIKAPRTRVYDAWTKPELMQSWFCPGNMIVPKAETDLRPGGSYRVEMQGSIDACEGSPADVDMSHKAVATGIYEKIVPNELLSFTWRGDWDASEVTLVTVEFRDVEGGTEVNLTHERFTSAESRNKHQHGWEGCLQKLEQFFGK